jgi:hypothetical protein
MSWRPNGDGVEVRPPGGEDATVWQWDLVSDNGDRHSVLVFVSGTAMSLKNVPFRVEHARQSSGHTEVSRILDWEEPPRRIILHSESQLPTYDGGEPGPEVRELTEIVSWFEERGLLLLFTARGRGIPRGEVEYTTHSANVIDQEADELVARSEARTRLEAARDARAWWIENREAAGGSGVELDLQPVEGKSSATLDLQTPDISSEQREHFDRREVILVTTGPDTDDPESGWMFEAYSKNGTLLGITVAATAQDAYLTLYDDLFPGDGE